MIVEAFYLTGKIEKYGTRLLWIRKAMEDYPELSFSLEKVNGDMLATIGKKTAQNRLNLSNELCCSAINVCHSGYIPHVDTGG
ncbi:MAG: hypothetical protein KAK04_00460 [Cyclobacteriaceae bacterium]|nr:hypothetical protein [Cyclobacteriaceae bacterium]